MESVSHSRTIRDPIPADFKQYRRVGTFDRLLKDNHKDQHLTNFRKTFYAVKAKREFAGDIVIYVSLALLLLVFCAKQPLPHPFVNVRVQRPRRSWRASPRNCCVRAYTSRRRWRAARARRRTAARREAETARRQRAATTVRVARMATRSGAAAVSALRMARRARRTGRNWACSSPHRRERATMFRIAQKRGQRCQRVVLSNRWRATVSASQRIRYNDQRHGRGRYGRCPP